MSSYPPPPPPNYPPGWNRSAWKAQRRMMQAQQRAYARQQHAEAKLMRARYRAQVRAARRSSLIGPLLLITLGVVFLLTQMGFLSWPEVLIWFSLWWPAVLIAAGLLLVGEWAFARQRAADDGRLYGGPILGGGVVFLLILLASFGWSLRYMHAGNVWMDRYFGSNWLQQMGEMHESDDALSSPIAAGAPLVIHNPQGDVTITGSSQDGQVHVSVHKQVHSWKRSQTEQREDKLQPTFSQQNGQLILSVPSVDASSADLTVELPHDSPVMIDASHGDITVSEIRGAVTLTGGHGDLDLSAITGPVTLHTNYDDGSVTGHSVTGPVTLDGRCGDISFSDVSGSLTLRGDFFGTTHLEHVTGPIRFETSRTQLQMARLDGEFDVDSDSDLQASQVMGPFLLTTRNRNVTLDRVAGQVQITDRNGSVNVTHAPPMAAIQVQNEHGSVDIGVPSDASFTVDAQTRDGDIENDFGLHASESDSHPTLQGAVGHGGPALSLTTTDGDITVRKTAVVPIPPAPPAPPKISSTPPAPASPARPPAVKPKLPAVPAVSTK